MKIAWTSTRPTSREGMTLELRRTDATDRFGEYNLAVFGPPSRRG
jgi:hypothetical protein